MERVLALSPTTSEQTADLRTALADTMDAPERSRRLKQQSAGIRRSVIEMIGRARLGHIGGDFSVADRLINVGIAEQNMVGVSAGLANGGFIPFVCAAGPFLTGRALEQIKVDVA